MKQCIVLLLTWCSAVVARAEVYVPSFQEVDERTVWALPNEFMAKIEDTEEKTSGRYICEAPGLIGAWIGQKFMGQHNDRSMAYFLAGLRCIRQACQGPIKELLVGRVNQYIDDPAKMKSDLENVYAGPETEDSITNQLKTKEGQEQALESLRAVNCLSPQSAALRVYVHDSCFVGQSCYELDTTKQSMPNASTRDSSFPGERDR